MHHVPAADCAISVYAGAFEGIGHAVAATGAEVDRSGECLLKQPRLAEAGSAVSANIANVYRHAEEVIRSCDVMVDVDLDAQCGA